MSDLPRGLTVGAASISAYVYGAVLYARRRARPWPTARSVAFVFGILCAAAAIDSPLDRAADARFVPHMLQHLILTDVAVPLMLLGGPLLLTLGFVSPARGRSVVRLLRSPFGRASTAPVVGWSAFLITLWAIHFTPFFEASLRNEWIHGLEHALLIGTAGLFWMPVVAVGPTSWASGPLSYPARMLYLLVAMPAQAFLGFAIYGARRVLYPSYAAAGLADQQAAGELMWIGSGFAMFVAFMIVGFEWARYEQRQAARADART